MSIAGVSVRVYPPCNSLSGYITFFYVVEIERPVTDFLYPEWANVRFALAGEWRVAPSDAPSFPANTATVFGPTDQPGLISTAGGTVVGFGLTPLGWHAVMRTDASLMTNRTARLTNQIGISAVDILAELQRRGDEEARTFLERVLLDRIASHPAISETVRRVDAAFRATPGNVVQFAARAGVSSRTLQRVCLSTFGFAPKRLLRLQRFLETLGRFRAAVHAPLAEGLGSTYYDQPQFYRDFREFIQMTPRAYLAANRQVMEVAAEAQVRAGVTLSFELPPPPD